MKRITSIQLENFRAFFGQYNPILLPKGENLLVYGENGSGKSSSFKALLHFFESSRDLVFVFEENSFATAPVTGSVSVNFVDVDPLTYLPLPGTDQLLSFNNTAPTHRILFVEQADVIKGFLDYRSLLKVYFGGNNNNVFDLIVNQILNEVIPVGEAVGIGLQLKQLRHRLKTSDRRYNDHHDAIAELAIFNGMLERFLRIVFSKVNRMLVDYFKFNLRVKYHLDPIVFNHDYGVWDIVQNMQLLITLNGVVLINHNEYLNEARLSALAICLYLAAIKRNPAAVDYKILFLDDVFIGLDASNRIPILQMLVNEFSEYQIFITTYDRHWYELAQRHLKVNAGGKWIFDNLFVGREKVGTKNFDKPILVQGDDDNSKALFYLHHPVTPDYPASANYLRKYAERILSTSIPTHEIRNDDYTLVDSYKLKTYVESCEAFLIKIGADIRLIKQLENALPTLLHPLSHFNLSSPVYKGELITIQKCLSDLDVYLNSLKANYRVFITPGGMMKIQFPINAVENYVCEIFSKDAIYLVNAPGGVAISSGGCLSKRNYVQNGVNINGVVSFVKTDPLINYPSLSAAYTAVYAYYSAFPGYPAFPIPADYANEILLPIGAAWPTLRSQIIW